MPILMGQLLRVIMPAIYHMLHQYTVHKWSTTIVTTSEQTIIIQLRILESLKISKLDKFKRSYQETKFLLITRFLNNLARVTSKINKTKIKTKLKINSRSMDQLTRYLIMISSKYSIFNKISPILNNGKAPTFKTRIVQKIEKLICKKLEVKMCFVKLD